MRPKMLVKGGSSGHLITHAGGGCGEVEARRRPEAEEQHIVVGCRKSGKTPWPSSEEPDPKAQRDFTDPLRRGGL